MAMTGSFTSCSDDVTLDGADAVYIDITPSEINIQVGQRQRISARVTNQDGKEIETPIIWSVDDETVARVVPVYKELPTPDPGTPDPGEGEGGGDTGDVEDPGTETQEAATDPSTPDEPEHGELLYYAVEAVPGAQGKSTYLRVQLENGKQAISPVTVVRGELAGAITPITTLGYSHFSRTIDTVLFRISSPTLLDDYVYNAEIIMDPADILDYTYTFPAEGSFPEREINTATTDRRRTFQLVDMDREDMISGDTLRVLFVGPYLASKATLRVSLTNPEHGNQEVVEVPLISYPDLSCGFEVNGKRPFSTPETPSNIKQTLLYQTIDINQTFNVSLCVGVLGGWDLDRAQVMACQDAGWFGWNIDGSSVIVEDEFYDLDYVGGVVPILQVRSGAREGLTVITYKTPLQTYTCNLQVEDYRVSHPIESIVVAYGIGDEYREYAEGEEIRMPVGETPFMDISVTPEASFEFHDINIEIADQSVLEPYSYGENQGYAQYFRTLAVGSTTITLSCLDKTRVVPVSVYEWCRYIDWVNPVKDAVVGTPFELKADVTLGSRQHNTNDITWTCSDPSLVTWTVKDGDPNTIVVTPVADGEVSFTASLFGVTSSAATVNIKALQDYEYSDSEDDAWYESIYTEDGLYLFNSGNEEIHIPSVVVDDPANLAGHYTGTDAVCFFLTNMTGCAYDLTITQTVEAEGGEYVSEEVYWTISGTITLPSGSKVVFNNTLLRVGD